MKKPRFMALLRTRLLLRQKKNGNMKKHNFLNFQRTTGKRFPGIIFINFLFSNLMYPKIMK